MNSRKGIFLITAIVLLGWRSWLLGTPQKVIEHSPNNEASLVAIEDGTHEKTVSEFEPEVETVIECDILGDEQNELIELYRRDGRYVLRVKQEQNTIFEENLPYANICAWQAVD